MSVHVVLLFEPEDASKQLEQSIACDLVRAGYEVMEAHDLNTAAALLYVSHRLEAVVVHAANQEINPEFARCITAIRPGLPLLLSNQILISKTKVRAAEVGNEAVEATTH
jgi:hypothetical protein